MARLRPLARSAPLLPFLVPVALSALAPGGLPPHLDVPDLAADVGFRFDGLIASSLTGSRLARIGDVNADGFADFAIGAPSARVGGLENVGQVYVVFGGPALTTGAPVDPDALDGATGFVVQGDLDGIRAGFSIDGLGDFNGDGIDDFVIGAPEFSTRPGTTGRAYVIFGSTRLGEGGLLRLLDLDGKNGLRIIGPAIGESVGAGVAGIGDVNADGFPDLAIGAPNASPPGPVGPRGDAGAVYVLFGGAALDSIIAPDGSVSLALIDARNGFRVLGFDLGAQVGYTVSAAGDVNADGVADFLACAPFALPNGIAYLFFGREGLGSTGDINLRFPALDALTVRGAQFESFLGFSAAALSDINADGVDDFVLGSPLSSPGGVASGQAFVVLGSPDLAPLLVIDAGAPVAGRSFVIDGAVGEFESDSGDLAGYSVAGGGDLNGDGAPDLVVAAPSGNVDGRINAGQAHIVFGSPWLSTIDRISLADIPLGRAATLLGGGINAQWGRGVAVLGDVNADGVDDVGVGGPAFDARGVRDAGSVAVVFGLQRTPGDLVCDGRVDSDDLAFLLGLWGASDPQADADGDGLVDARDLAVVLANWTAVGP
jgi:hypothetical protein